MKQLDLPLGTLIGREPDVHWSGLLTIEVQVLQDLLFNNELRTLVALGTRAPEGYAVHTRIVRGAMGKNNNLFSKVMRLDLFEEEVYISSCMWGVSQYEIIGAMGNFPRLFEKLNNLVETRQDPAILPATADSDYVLTQRYKKYITKKVKEYKRAY